MAEMTSNFSSLDRQRRLGSVRFIVERGVKSAMHETSMVIAGSFQQHSQRVDGLLNGVIPDIRNAVRAELARMSQGIQEAVSVILGMPQSTTSVFLNQFKRGKLFGVFNLYFILGLQFLVYVYEVLFLFNYVSFRTG